MNLMMMMMIMNLMMIMIMNLMMMIMNLIMMIMLMMIIMMIMMIMKLLMIMMIMKLLIIKKHINQLNYYNNKHIQCQYKQQFKMVIFVIIKFIFLIYNLIMMI